MGIIKLLTSLILVATALIIILQNTQIVETRFLFMTVAMPRATLLGIAMLIGVFIGILLALTLSRKNSPKD